MNIAFDLIVARGKKYGPFSSTLIGAEVLTWRGFLRQALGKEKGRSVRELVLDRRRGGSTCKEDSCGCQELGEVEGKAGGNGEEGRGRSTRARGAEQRRADELDCPGEVSHEMRCCKR